MTHTQYFPELEKKVFACICAGPGQWRSCWGLRGAGGCWAESKNLKFQNGALTVWTEPSLISSPCGPGSQLTEPCLPVLAWAQCVHVGTQPLWKWDFWVAMSSNLNCPPGQGGLWNDPVGKDVARLGVQFITKLSHSFLKRGN